MENAPITTKVFNDPIHGSIELPPLLIKIIDTPQFQRLRFIKQLGGVYFVYPGASHNRFEHSIGVAYLAGELATALKTRQPKLDITDEDILCVQIAGLCHDLGHGPFSHLYDDIFLPKALGNREWKHEQGSCDMLDHLLTQNRIELGPDDITFIKEMIVGPLQEAQGREWPYKGRPIEKAFLYEIVSNKNTGIDVAKFDYLARDSYHLGIKNNFDYHRFMKFARVCEVDGKKTICTRDKEEDHMYELFSTRHRLHKRAYQHRVSQIIQEMIAEAFWKAEEESKKPQASRESKESIILSTAIDDMVAYTQLTDNVFEKILNSDLKAKEILKNIITRKIYKFVGETRPIPKPRKHELINRWQDFCSSVKDKIPVWKGTLAKRLNAGGAELSADDFVILVVNMDYGKKDEDPIKHMHFYSKSKPNEEKPMSKDQESRIRTTCFSEQLIRVFYKKTDKESVEAANLPERFKKWSKKEEFLVGLEGN